ncbi:MAG: PAS domain-containing protein [Bdellovibrionales bacterium]|nr:PAS domain-containing protein [Bdellovibrionales bacterium]
MDYSFFDSLIDGVFVIDQEKNIVYCNDAAATLAHSSVRRLTKSQSVKVYDVINVSQADYFVTKEGTNGQDSPAPVQEMDMMVLKDDSSLKVQLSIQPFQDPKGNPRWTVMIHDVTLEERLHTKYQGELEQKEDMIAELKDAREQLEQYSKNLEQMVEERTKQVKKANKMLQAIMNSLGQGFLVFDSTGMCGDIYTEACKEVLESTPKDQNIADVLGLKEGEKEQFQQWQTATFSQALPFDSMKELAPKEYHHSEADRFITLDYFPIFTEDDQLENVVLVATDKTVEHQAAIALEKEQEFVKMVTKLIRNKNQFSEFLGATKENIFAIQGILQKSSGDLDPDFLFRALHTLEGEAAAFHAWKIRQRSREFQTLLEPIRRDERPPSSEELSEMLESCGTLRSSYYEFIKDNQDIFDLVSLGDERKIELSAKDLLSFANSLTAAGVHHEIVEDFKAEFIFQDVPSLLHHYNDAVQQVAERQEKKVKPIMFENSGVRVLPEPYQKVVASLVHVFRNSVDHGIESPSERAAAGKDEFGHITVSSSFVEQGGQRRVHVVIRDDGKGIDIDKLRDKITGDKGPEFAAGLTDNQIMLSIFEAGFSSRDQVGEFSGRGVGMDAVKAAVEDLGGVVRVDSTLGKETIITIDLPDLSRETASIVAA